MDRIARYGGLKTRAREMAEFVYTRRDPNRPDIHSVYVNLTQCANYLVFHDYYTVEQLRLVKAQTCKKHMLCPFCAARRAARMVQQNLPKVEQIMAENRARIPVMVTFTVKNGPDLMERFRHLTKALRCLTQRRRNAHKGQKWTEWAKVAGAIRSIEITNHGEGWHPHAHMVALLDDFIDQKALAREWQEITGDSFIVDIRRIKPKDPGAGGLDISDGLLEVFKYALKFSDLELEDTWHAYTQLKGRRLVDGFGVLRGVQLPESLLDDPLDDLPYLELVYRYHTKKAAYDLTESKKVTP